MSTTGAPGGPAIFVPGDAPPVESREASGPLPVAPAAPTHILTVYQSPSARALDTALKAAGGLAAACAVFVLPLLKEYVDKGVFTHASLIALLSAIVSAILGVLGTYAVKYISAKGTDTKPQYTVVPTTQGDAPRPS